MTEKDYELKSAIEQHLKVSKYIQDIQATHRQATAEILNAFLKHLAVAGKLDPRDIPTVLHQLEKSTGQPSLRGEIGNIASAIRNASQRGD